MHAALILALGRAVGGIANAGDIYRWIDAQGNVHYTDQEPPPTARKVERVRLGYNSIDVDLLPYGTQIAVKKNPVTLYNSDCGDPCTAARALLGKRGIPHSSKDPSASPEVFEALTKLVGKAQVPVLVIGDNPPLRGFEPGSWEQALDAAGYPKTASLPRPATAAKPAPPAPEATPANTSRQPAQPPTDNSTPKPEATPAPPAYR